ncbi:MAG TPA: hypothetical protein PKK33_06400 [Candidatus Cloacimonadota bacterium]|nr:hypothetical protein [Candidatus Cloacimonadota bacterium]
MRKLLLFCLLVSCAAFIHGVVITQWDFDSQSLTPSIGTGSISLIGGVTNDGYSTGYSTTYGLSTTTYPAQSTNNLTAGIYFEVSTLGYSNISLSWNHRFSNTSANKAVLYYTLDKTASPVVWTAASTLSATAGDSWFQKSYDGSSISSLNSNPNLAFKIVSSFGDAGNTVYMPSKTSSTYAASGKWRFDDIIIQGTPVIPSVQIVADLSHFYSVVNQSSIEQNYTVNGYNMISNLLITAPQYFGIRVGSTGSYGSSVTLTPVLGSISASIEVRFSPTESGTQIGIITHSGTGFNTQELSVTGSTVLPEPTSHVTNLHATQVSYYQLHLNWIDSGGGVLPDGYLIKGSKIAPDSILNPVDGIVQDTKKLTQYVNYGVQDAPIYELDENRVYFFKVFPYTNSGAQINYLTDGDIPEFTVDTAIGPTGTTLSAGDIAFTEYGSDSPDRFAFILLRDITENTKISFTDKGWDGSALMDGEDIFYWRGVGRSYARGEVIHVIEDTLLANEGINNPSFTGFSNNGDQILAFQGATDSPTFIAGFSTSDWLTTGVPTNNSSYLPTSLMIGETALGFSSEIDNGYYNGAVLSGTAQEIRESINDPNNWIRSNSLTGFTFPAYTFSVSSPIVEKVSITKIGITTAQLSWSSFSGATSYNIYYSDTPSTSDRDWQLYQSGVVDTFLEVSFPSDNTIRRFFYIKANH